ncbi:MAG: NmrA family NAD(P)-binding protein [Bryobacteraceae bacterium]|nr:NmrA family NAD(P)-binding protein [Bryobacteraceae bacterium]
MLVLVTGATGKQGGAVAQKLLDSGHQVRALTRKVGSESAADLREQGAEVVGGTLDDPESLRLAAEGVDAIFGMTTPFEAGMDAEVRQGRNLVDAAESLSVPLVFTSVAWAYSNSGIPHFETKWQTEKYLTSKDIPHTILGPGFFMENTTAPWTLPALRDQGVLAVPLTAKVPVACIAVGNIADAVVYALENPDQMNGKRFDLAGEIYSGEHLSRMLSEVTGRKIGYYEVDKSAVQDDDLRVMFEWYESEKPTVDIPALQAAFPGVHFYTCREWVESQNWSELLGS